MHKIVVTYKDFDEQTQVEEVYFNLSRAKIIDMAITGDADTLLVSLQNAVKAEDGKELIRLVRDLIHLSYGEKDPDGKTFRQSAELSDDFLQSQPFDQMFYDMIMSPEQVLAFVNALFPEKLMVEARARAQAAGVDVESLALPREDGQPYFDAETTRASRPQPQDRLPKQTRSVVDVDLPEDDTPVDPDFEADMSAFREWQRQHGKA